MTRLLSLVVVLLALGALRAEAQAAIDDLDTGSNGSRAAISARWASSQIVDVDPDEPGSSSAGLRRRSVADRRPGRLRRRLHSAAPREHDLHAARSFELAGTNGRLEPRATFHTNGADDVWLRGHGDGSVISYTQVGSGLDRLVQNWLLTANKGSDRVLFSDFRVERTDQCTVDCQEYAMIFTAVGDVSDVVIDNVTVHSTAARPQRGLCRPQRVHGVRRRVPVDQRGEHTKRVVVRNSRFLVLHRHPHQSLQRLPDRRHHFDAAGAPDDVNGARVRAFTTFKGKNYLIAKNSMDMALDGRLSTNWTGCVLLQGDQTFDPNEPHRHASTRAPR